MIPFYHAMSSPVIDWVSHTVPDHMNITLVRVRGHVLFRGTSSDLCIDWISHTVPVHMRQGVDQHSDNEGTADAMSEWDAAAHNHLEKSLPFHSGESAVGSAEGLAAGAAAASAVGGGAGFMVRKMTRRHATGSKVSKNLVGLNPCVLLATLCERKACHRI